MHANNCQFIFLCLPRLEVPDDRISYGFHRYFGRSLDSRQNTSPDKNVRYILDLERGSMLSNILKVIHSVESVNYFTSNTTYGRTIKRILIIVNNTFHIYHSYFNYSRKWNSSPMSEYPCEYNLIFKSKENR